MAIDISTATPEQIAEFKQAAADRYAELGVPPNVAEQLFNNQLSKCAEELGITVEDTEPKADQ